MQETFMQKQELVEALSNLSDLHIVMLTGAILASQKSEAEFHKVMAYLAQRYTTTKAKKA